MSFNSFNLTFFIFNSTFFLRSRKEKFAQNLFKKFFKLNKVLLSLSAEFKNLELWRSVRVVYCASLEAMCVQAPRVRIPASPKN